MKRIITILLASAMFLGFSTFAEAQINISSDMLNSTRTFEIKAAIKDSLTREPVAFASVYLHHPKDTLITDFTLSDAEGVAKLPKIPIGEVVFTVEMFGYKPFVKTMYVRKDVDLGDILMKVDEQQLEAAKVTAAANPIEVLQDTLVYNAAAFKTGSNASLGDLLKKMPGIEVGDDGSVTVNGKAVSRITVGGKTFFMGDNSMALNNLPATIVNKVKVIDQDSKESQFTGVRDTEKERVMDVELKEEYKQGWFGNAKVAAGTQIPGKNDSEYIEKGKPLYNGNLMASIYNETDQLTLVSGGNNARSYGDGIAIAMRDVEDLNLPRGGVNTSWQAGANLNTDRIKGMKSTGLVSYNGSQAKVMSRSDRTTFREGEDLLTSNIGTGGGTSNIYKMNFELENKKKDKMTVHFEPVFYFLNVHKHSNENTSTSLGDELQNTSRAFTGGRSLDYETRGNLTFGIKKLGKEKRSVNFYMNYDLEKLETDSYDRSVTTLESSGTVNELNLDYDKDASTRSLNGTVSYVEPFGERWLLRAGAGMAYTDNNTIKDAYNTDGSLNSWYSSSTRSLTNTTQGNLRLQYSKGRTSIQVGGYVYTTENEVRASSYGMNTVTGKGDRYYNYSPYISLKMFPKGFSIDLDISGRTTTPTNTQMAPSFDLASPTRITLGNIYLEPVSRQQMSFTLRKSFNKTQAMFSLSGYLYREEDGVVNASWFDKDGIRYSIPVNARHPSGYASFNGNFMAPLDKAKKLRLTAYAMVWYNTSTGYQSKGTLEGIDTDSFDYSSFMETFWGDGKGGNFYSGKSGFSESRTTTLRLSPYATLRYSPISEVAISVGFSSNLTRSEYSLDPRANMNLWQDRYLLNGEFTLPREFELRTNFSYNSYRGDTSKSYAKPYTNWDMRIQKSIKAMSLGFEIFNILNHNREFSRTASEEYMVDSYSNRLGRYFLLTFSYRFGKLNAAKNSAARSSLWKMSF